MRPSATRRCRCSSSAWGLSSSTRRTASRIGATTSAPTIAASRSSSTGCRRASPFWARPRRRTIASSPTSPNSSARRAPVKTYRGPLGHRTHRAVGRLAVTHPRGPQDRPQGGDGRAPVGSHLRLRLAHVQPEAVEVDVVPRERGDLGAPQARVERGRVRDLVVRFQRREQLRGVLGGAYAHVRLLVVGRELNGEGGVAVHHATSWARCPAVDRRRDGQVVADARARDALAGEAVGHICPSDLEDLGRRAGAELFLEWVVERALVAGERGLAVRGALLAAALADRPVFDTVKPNLAELRECRSRGGSFSWSASWPFVLRRAR